MKTVLACIDFSEVTSPILESATGLCAALGARLCLLHVVSHPEGPGVIQPEEPGARIRKAKSKLDELAESVRRHGVDVTAKVEEWVGKPAGKIISEAEKSSAGLVVLGSHGHGALFNLLLGSTAEGVLRAAPCPVFVVPSRKVEKRGAFDEAKPTRTATA